MAYRKECYGDGLKPTTKKQMADFGFSTFTDPRTPAEAATLSEFCSVLSPLSFSSTESAIAVVFVIFVRVGA
jgi:hypothetical protein